MLTLRGAIDSWHKAPDYREAYAEMQALAADMGGGITFYVRGASGLSIDVQLSDAARGVPAGPALKVYLNDDRARVANPARVDLAETVGRAVARWVKGTDHAAAARDLAAKIAGFRASTEEEQHTDTGEAWDLLDEVDELLKALAHA